MAAPARVVFPTSGISARTPGRSGSADAGKKIAPQAESGAIQVLMVSRFGDRLSRTIPGNREQTRLLLAAAILSRLHLGWIVGGLGENANTPRPFADGLGTTQKVRLGRLGWGLYLGIDRASPTERPGTVGRPPGRPHFIRLMKPCPVLAKTSLGTTFYGATCLAGIPPFTRGWDRRRPR
jgi:hypothetical protein